MDEGLQKARLYSEGFDASADGFFRVGAATPRIRVGDVAGNVEAIIDAVEQAAAEGVGALVLPELCVTGYTCGDLFGDSALTRAAEDGVREILQRTSELPLVFAVGVPVAVSGALHNCAAVCCRGRLLGLTAKANIPNYGEFYEARWFAPAPETPIEVQYAGQHVLLGSRVVYDCDDLDGLSIGVEICEDLWVAAPPSVEMALAGATVILNLSASDELVDKDSYRRQLVESQSGRLYCAYAYADAGMGESTTDLVFAGADIVAENGAALDSTPLLSCSMAACDVDLGRLAHERRRSNTWVPDPDAASARIRFDLGYSLDGRLMTRSIPRTPFVPSSVGDLEARCETILGIQSTGLVTRLSHTGIKSAVIGVSGGLDSTLALLVAVRAFDSLDLPRSGIVAISMPGFGTTERTRSNALLLAQTLGATVREVPIGPAVERHFSDIGHDPAVTDATYENSQARERTQILMDTANQEGGIVVGTGDLSELALGWSTYNGDHMSMYAVNAGVPKTLVRHLVRYAAGTMDEPEAAKVLLDVLDTPVSPELLPPTGDGKISQRTEEIVGPYELHDFFLYHMVRQGAGPQKIFRMACRAFGGDAGEGEAASYDPPTILKWLRTFYRRFFSQQFKRSCLPDGPKVGSVTLSPRGDWRMPSDASVRLWLDQLDELG